MRNCKHWIDGKCVLGLGGGAPSEGYCAKVCSQSVSVKLNDQHLPRIATTETTRAIATKPLGKGLHGDCGCGRRK